MPLRGLWGSGPAPAGPCDLTAAPYDPSPIAEGDEDVAGWDADLETLRHRLNEATREMGESVKTLRAQDSARDGALVEEGRRRAAANVGTPSKAWRGGRKSPRCAPPDACCPRRRLPIGCFLLACALVSMTNSASFLSAHRARADIEAWYAGVGRHDDDRSGATPPRPIASTSTEAPPSDEPSDEDIAGAAKLAQVASYEEVTAAAKLARGAKVLNDGAVGAKAMGGAADEVEDEGAAAPGDSPRPTGGTTSRRATASMAAPPPSPAPPPAPASCLAHNKFDFDVVDCDSGCQPAAKKFHCEMCKCKGCGWCDKLRAPGPATAARPANASAARPAAAGAAPAARGGGGGGAPTAKPGAAAPAARKGGAGGELAAATKPPSASAGRGGATTAPGRGPPPAGKGKGKGKEAEPSAAAKPAAGKGGGKGQGKGGGKGKGQGKAKSAGGVGKSGEG